MINLLKRYWNFSFLSLPFLVLVLFNASTKKLYEFFFSFFLKKNLKSCGKKFIAQKGVEIRYPDNIKIGNFVFIGKEVVIDSEFPDSLLNVGNKTQINKGCEIDFTGNLVIGNNVVVSENVNLMSHSHGYFPKSIPIRVKKVIEDNVWIGAGSIILPQVTKIGQGAIIAAGAVVTKDVSPNTIVGGNPAIVIAYK